jgi:uncharacterized protein YigA (DUF484 family)
MASLPRPAGGITAEAVETYLRANPRFLAERPAIYRALAPPTRLHGERLADHMAAMLHAERAHAAAMAERADGVLAAGRAAAGLAARVQEAVLALLQASDAVECIGAELPALLGIDAAALCIESDRVAGARPLPAGTVARLLGSRTLDFRDDSEDARLLHGEAAGLACRAALVRVGGNGPPALLALAAREATALDPSQGTGALNFLGRAVAASLGR